MAIRRCLVALRSGIQRFMLWWKPKTSLVLVLASIAAGLLITVVGQL